MICLLVCNPYPYLVIRKDNKDGEADEGEDDEVGKADRQDGAGPHVQGEEIAYCNQLAKEEQACTNHPEKKKDLDGK